MKCDAKITAIEFFWQLCSFSSARASLIYVDRKARKQQDAFCSKRYCFGLVAAKKAQYLKRPTQNKRNLHRNLEGHKTKTSFKILGLLEHFQHMLFYFANALSLQSPRGRKRRRGRGRGENAHHISALPLSSPPLQPKQACVNAV